MIELNLADEQLQECSRHYKTQRDALIRVLDENLPSSCTFIKPRGGYFVWVKLPENFSQQSSPLSLFLQENYKVTIIEGSRFSLEGKFKNFIRISFAFHSPEIIEAAAKRLCEGIKNYLDGV